MNSQYYKVTAYVGTPHRNAVDVTIPLVGPAGPVGSVGPTGPQGPQGVPGTGLEVLTTQGDLLYQGASTGQRLPIGTAGQILKVNSGGTAPEWGQAPASGVSSVNGQAGAVTITPASIDAAEDNHSHQPAAIFVDAAKVTSSSAIFAGIYFRNGDDNGKGLYEDPSSRNYFWWDSDLSKWFLANAADASRFESSSNTLFPWQATGWTAISPQTGTLTVAQANLYEASGASANESLLRTPKSGNATSDQLVLGSDSRLSDSRTPTSHTHTLSAITDAGTAAAVDADQDLNTTSSVTFDIVNVTSELVASSIKATSQIEIEDNNSYLATISTGGDNLSANRNYQLPNASGTLALTTDAPSNHAASHAAAGSDPVFNQDLNSNSNVSFASVTVADVSLGQQDGDIQLGNGTKSINFDAGTITNFNVAASGSITTSGLTQATARILGRTTASTGAVEELSSSDVRSFLNVADGAEQNVQADWNESDNTQDDFIRNKPTLGTAAASNVGDFAAASHNHAASAITSGTLDVARIPTGTTSTTVALGNHSHELTSLAATGATNGTVLTANGSGGVTFAAASGGVGGSTGSTSQAILRASGTGGSTAQSSDLVIDDYTATTQGNVTIAPRSVSFSATIAASDDFVTATGHTFANGDQVTFTSLTGGAGLTANIRYFVRDSATNVFKVATTVSGTAVDVTTNYTAATVERIAAVVINTRNVAPFIVGPKPDGTAVGGDARGLRAINIAMSREASTEVASGDDSIAIGSRSSATGLRGAAVGRLARANATSATAIGNATNSTGISSTAIGENSGATANGAVAIGNTVSASAQDSVAIGSYDANDTNAIATAIRCVGLNAVANMRGMLATRPFNAVFWGGQTTDGTANVELNLDATATNRMVIAANTAVIADISLIARRTDNTKFLAARRWVAIRRDGSNNTALIGAVQTIGTDQSEGSPTWTFTIDADDTASVESLRVRVTGAASETVNWRVCAIYRVVA